ncbi:MAG: adenine phosphoribosyltransferase [Firmicutes bacterium]|nr:adenine phosphoribosyltransferase [Bacillota bacterium]
MEKQKYFEVDIAGRKEKLEILPLPGGLSIAFFNLHGNVDLTERCAKALAKKGIGEAEIIITPESKGLQLSHCLARELGHKQYAVVRKSKKMYMDGGLFVKVKSITSDTVQEYYLSKHDIGLIKGKKVAIVDDVISTGGSVRALQDLVSQAGGLVVSKMCVLAEGDAKDRQDIVYLASIPVL